VICSYDAAGQRTGFGLIEFDRASRSNVTAKPDKANHNHSFPWLKCDKVKQRHNKNCDRGTRRFLAHLIQTKNDKIIPLTGIVEKESRQTWCMEKLLILSTVLLGAVSASQAGINLSIGIGLPIPPPPPFIISRPSPVCVTPAPPPICEPASPVVFAPPLIRVTGPPFVVALPPVFFPHRPGHFIRHGWRHFHDCR
jgi:hypothetical protein